MRKILRFGRGRSQKNMQMQKNDEKDGLVTLKAKTRETRRRSYMFLTPIKVEDGQSIRKRIIW